MFAETLVVLLTALAIGLLFSAVFRASGPWEGPLWFFLVLFLSTWAIGSWIEPVGPTVWGVTWVPFLMIALFVALILAAATPPRDIRYRPWSRRRPRSVSEAAEEAEEEVAAVAAVGFFFWILIFVLLLAVLLNAFAVFS